MSPLLRTSLALLAVLALASCRIGKSTEAALLAAEAFHEQYNHSEFAGIYRTASPAFQKARTEAEFLKAMRKNQAKLGTFQSASRTGTSINAHSSKKFTTSGGWESDVGTTITLTYHSQFQHGPAVETITFLISGQKALLQDYKCETQGPNLPRNNPTNRLREYI